MKIETTTEAGKLTPLVIDKSRLPGWSREADYGSSPDTRKSTGELKHTGDAPEDHKARTLAAICHDLRTPLNSILAWTQLALRSPEKCNTKEALIRIETNARLQATLINKILDDTRSASTFTEIEATPVDIHQVVAAALDVVGPLTRERDLHLVYERPTASPRVMGDPLRLQQVVWNLLDNAAKFTPCGGTIKVQLQTVGTLCRLAVTDTGCGISPEFLPRIFDRFEQDPSPTGRGPGGFGLGLAIVHRIVQLHRGSITAESPGRNKGATFTVLLPALC